MINTVVLVGRAGGDPKVTTFSSGTKVAEVGIALNRRPVQGLEKQVTDWFQVKFWNKTADIAEQYLKKGHLFGVTGELRQETWEEDGKQRSKVVVVGHRLKLMQPRSDGGSTGGSTIPASVEDIFGDLADMPF